MTRYLLLWCSSVPKDETGDADLDRAVMVFEVLPTFEEVVARAKSVLRSGLDFFGSVEVIKQDAAPNVGLWDDTASLYVDDIERSYTAADLRTSDECGGDD